MALYSSGGNLVMSGGGAIFSGGIPTPPNTYSATTNTNVYTDGSPPTLGAAGTTYTDPTFGTTILRVTDANTLSSFSRTGISFFPTDGSAEIRRCNVGCTRFLSHCQGGEDLIFDFNASGFTASLHTVNGSYSPNISPGPVFANSCFSSTDPDTIYGVDGSNNVSAYDIVSDSLTSNVWNTSGISGAAGYNDFSLALANGVMVMMLGAQDTATLVGTYDPSGPTQRVLDVNAGTINGVTAQIYIGGTATSWIAFSVHNVTIGQDGRYVKITPTGTNVGTHTGYVIWDIQTGTVSLVSVNIGGHQAVGYGYMTNADPNNGYEVRIRSLTSQSGIANPTLLNTNSYTAENYYDQYQSWENAQSGRLVPLGWTHCTEAVAGPYPYHPTITNPWQREVTAIATDGSGTVWRFAHTFMYDNGDFQEECFAHMFANGLYFLFHSNMQNTLGTSSADGSLRTDLFLAKLVPSG